MFHDALRKILGVTPPVQRQSMPAPTPFVHAPVDPRRPSVLNNMSFGNNRTVGAPLPDEGIYANTPDVSTTSPRNTMGYARTGNPIKSATMYTPVQPKPSIQSRYRYQ